MNIIEPQTGGGGWISGPSITTPEPPDPRPAYDPELIVRGVLALLSDDGVALEPTLGQRRVAAVQAAKLLTSLGVRSDPTPERAR